MCVRACVCVLPGEISSLRRSKGERKWNTHPQGMMCLCGSCSSFCMRNCHRPFPNAIVLSSVCWSAMRDTPILLCPQLRPLLSIFSKPKPNARPDLVAGAPLPNVSHQQSCGVCLIS